jgi:hypothetical protein
MKFPLRLSLDLWRTRFRRALSGSAPKIFHLPAEMLPALHENPAVTVAAANGHTAADSVRTAAHSTAPVLWIGGTEPLDHAEVGRVAFALNAKGRNVFVHTDGQRLRQRIHEFRPDDRLFLTVELAGREGVHGAAVGRPGASRLVIEGIRAAKLSGFHVCAHVTAHERSDACQIGGLFEYLDGYDVDGYVISAGGRSLTTGAPLQEKMAELLPLIRCKRWEYFSRLLEASYSARVATGEVVASPDALIGEKTQAVEETV